MRRPSRWIGTVFLAAVVWWATPSAVVGEPPCDRLPPLAASDDYRSGDPIVLIGVGAASTTLVVDRLPTDRYGVVTVASKSDRSFALTITPPNGAARLVFATDTPDALTGALLLDQQGTYTITVAATGGWALVLR